MFSTSSSTSSFFPNLWKNHPMWEVPEARQEPKEAGDQQVSQSTRPQVRLGLDKARAFGHIFPSQPACAAPLCSFWDDSGPTYHPLPKSPPLITQTIYTARRKSTSAFCPLSLLAPGATTPHSPLNPAQLEKPLPVIPSLSTPKQAPATALVQSFHQASR